MARKLMLVLVALLLVVPAFAIGRNEAGTAGTGGAASAAAAPGTYAEAPELADLVKAG